MESIFEDKQRNKRNRQITLPEELAKKLESLQKGSFRQTIEYLLGNNADVQLKTKVSELGKDVIKLQETIENLVKVNHLRSF